jgi:hypothetical protein
MILYHIGPGPPQPVPPKRGNWYREHKQIEFDEKVVFLTNNYCRVWRNHGRHGNLYIYDVPKSVIKESGGINTYDFATEVIIPEHLWNQCKFIGSVREEKVNQKCLGSGLAAWEVGPPIKKTPSVQQGDYVHWMNAEKKNYGKGAIFYLTKSSPDNAFINYVGKVDHKLEYDDNRKRFVKKRFINKDDINSESIPVKIEHLYPVDKDFLSSL